MLHIVWKPRLPGDSRSSESPWKAIHNRTALTMDFNTDRLHSILAALQTSRCEIMVSFFSKFIFKSTYVVGKLLMVY